jgi:hypothetical protein
MASANGFEFPAGKKVEIVSHIRSRSKRIISNTTGKMELVSAAGFEPATHALKGHCSTN